MYSALSVVLVQLWTMMLGLEILGSGQGFVQAKPVMSISYSPVALHLVVFVMLTLASTWAAKSAFETINFLGQMHE